MRIALRNLHDAVMAHPPSGQEPWVWCGLTMFTKQVSGGGRSGSPIVAAEAQQVERTRRKTWSRALKGTESLDSPLRSLFVLMVEAAQDVDSSHAQDAGNRCGGIRQRVRRSQVDPGVRPLGVVVGDVFAERAVEMTPTEDERPVKAFTLTVRTHRSAKAFALGARTGVRTASMPSAAKTASKLLVYLESRSLIRWRNRPHPGRSHERLRAVCVT
jgi:hypothetical protein